MRNRHFQSLCITALLFSGCVTVPDTEGCAVAGKLRHGMLCAHSNFDSTRELTFEQAIEFLEPQLERDDPENPGKKLPPRGGAICRSASDTQKLKTALEQACRELAGGCSYETRRAIQGL